MIYICYPKEKNLGENGVWVGGVFDRVVPSHQRGMWAKRSDETGRASFSKRCLSSCTVMGDIGHHSVSIWTKVPRDIPMAL